MIHHTRGVYPSGDFKDNGVSSKNIALHICYNLQMRPGRALFVDGFCLNQGIGVSKELIAQHEAQTKDKKMTRDTVPYV